MKREKEGKEDGREGWREERRKEREFLEERLGIGNFELENVVTRCVGCAKPVLIRRYDSKEKQSQSHSNHILLFSEAWRVTSALVSYPFATQSSSAASRSSLEIQNRERHLRPWESQSSF